MTVLLQLTVSQEKYPWCCRTKKSSKGPLAQAHRTERGLRVIILGIIGNHGRKLQCDGPMFFGYQEEQATKSQALSISIRDDRYKVSSLKERGLLHRLYCA